MKEIKADVAVIGGGPAGLAAALEVQKRGLKPVIFERDAELGGILQQCIHDGFGLHRFGKHMSGNQYAQAFIDEVQQQGIERYLDTMVLELTSEKVLYACNKKDGMIRAEAGAVILAMGCRERTASQILLFGERPAGVMTAGSVQRYINMEGYLPGKKAVILGSGDIGLIMARRMTLEGIEVEGVYEVMEHPGGLTRNLVQCLDDYGIPLHLATTVTCVHGKHTLEGVSVAKLGPDRKPMPETERYIPCDLLVLAVGLIPENELSLQAGVEIDEKTKGPVLDENFMTSVPGIFAAGNVALVFDLVDYVSLSGEIAARGAVNWLTGEKQEGGYRKTKLSGNINFAVPQRIHQTAEGEQTFFMRVKKPQKNAALEFIEDGTAAGKKAIPFAAPPEMVLFQANIHPDTECQLMIKEKEL